MNPQPAAAPRSTESQFHPATSRCPTCDQPVPNDKLNEITARLSARDQEVRERLSKDFATRIAQLDAEAKAELQRVANDNAVTIERLKQDAANREIAVRLETKIETEASLRDQLADAAQLREAAEQSAASKDREIEKLRTDSAATIESLKNETLARELAARADAKAEAEASLRSKLDESNEARKFAEAQVTTLTATQEQRLEEQRTALENDKVEAVNAEKAKAFDEKLKLETQLKDMARQLEKKTADELGEGAEVKLLEVLKERFQGDKFDPVGKGNPGADLIHEVMHNGKACGRIVYDSKNRNAWRNEYISKLRKDQVAAEADYAILSTQTLPAGAKQLHIQDSVIVANPARVVIVVELLRQWIVRSHKLRFSNESKSEKTALLYTFMTSELCAQLFNQIETRAANILDLDAKEKQAHEHTWKRRGELVRGVQKAHGDLNAQIEIVLGTGSDASDTEQ